MTPTAECELQSTTHISYRIEIKDQSVFASPELWDYSWQLQWRPVQRSALTLELSYTIQQHSELVMSIQKAGYMREKRKRTQREVTTRGGDCVRPPAKLLKTADGAVLITVLPVLCASKHHESALNHPSWCRESCREIRLSHYSYLVCKSFAETPKFD